jgi:hypothetical protein
MKLKTILIVSAFAFVTSLGQAHAGPLMKMLEEKKAKQAASSGSTAPAAQAQQAPAAATNDNSKFATAKTKCKELGNKPGSDKFNSCVMTLME